MQGQEADRAKRVITVSKIPPAFPETPGNTILSVLPLAGKLNYDILLSLL